MRALDVYNQIKVLTGNVIATGLCNDQNFPAIVQRSQRLQEITISGGITNSFLKNMHYNDMYKVLLSERAYNLRMIDGALISMQYTFRKGDILKHRLAFLPAPNLDDFQNNSDLYLDDEIYADIVDNRIVPFPFRFDFDKTETAVPIEHPVSHLTLGQYVNCRIPVNSALTPYQFLGFIIRNFYNLAYRKYSHMLHNYDGIIFDETIDNDERKVIHINTPISHI